MYFVAAFGYLVYIYVRILVKILLVKSSVDVPDVVVLRKKPYPDIGWIRSIMSCVSSAGASSEAVLSEFSNKGNKFDLVGLQYFRGAITRSFLVFMKIVKDLWSYSVCVSNSGAPISFMRRMIYDAYHMSYIATLGSKAYVGIVHSKPSHILLARYLNQNQKLLTIFETYLYDPFSSYDYVYADVYYSLSEKEASSINKYGGMIKKFYNIGYWTGGIFNESGMHLSRELSQSLAEFNRRVIVTLATIGCNKYSYYDKESLVELLESLLVIAKKFSEVLFVIKEKKGEMRCIPEELLIKLSRIGNIFIVRSDKPMLIEYDRFESLLGVASLVISMNPGSMSLWQSLYNKIPVIALNQLHPPTFLNRYPYVEVDLNGLESAVNYWLYVDECEKIQTLKELREVIEPNEKLPLAELCDNIISNISTD